MKPYSLFMKVPPNNINGMMNIGASAMVTSNELPTVDTIYPGKIEVKKLWRLFCYETCFKEALWFLPNDDPTLATNKTIATATKNRSTAGLNPTM